MLSDINSQAGLGCNDGIQLLIIKFSAHFAFFAMLYSLRVLRVPSGLHTMLILYLLAVIWRLVPNMM